MVKDQQEKVASEPLLGRPSSTRSRSAHSLPSDLAGAQDTTSTGAELRARESVARGDPLSDTAQAGSAGRRTVDAVASGPASWRAYLRALGPGLVTGASDDDPSGIATYSQTGARFGFGMLWVALLTFPLMAGVQEISDRTALATGKGLGDLMVARFGRAWRVVTGLLIGALIVANALNIAADLVAVGAGMNLLHAGPTAVWAVLAGVITMALLVSGSFATIARVFKILCAALLA